MSKSYDHNGTRLAQSATPGSNLGLILSFAGLVEQVRWLAPAAKVIATVLVLEHEDGAFKWIGIIRALFALAGALIIGPADAVSTCWLVLSCRWLQMALLLGTCDLLLLAFPLVVTLAWLRVLRDLEGAAAALVVTAPLILGYDLDHTTIGRLFSFRVTLLGEALALVVNDGRATKSVQSANAAFLEHTEWETHYWLILHVQDRAGSGSPGASVEGSSGVSSGSSGSSSGLSGSSSGLSGSSSGPLQSSQSGREESSPSWRCRIVQV